MKDRRNEKIDLAADPRHLNEDLSGARLGGSNGSGGTLIGCKLEDARIEEDPPHLRMRRCSGALSARPGTCFELCHLLACDLQGADLLASKWSFSRLEEVDLSRANLAGVEFDGARVSSSNFTGANLQGVWARDTRFDGTIFCGADLRGATLTDNTSLLFADLTGANLMNISLSGNDLPGKGLLAVACAGAIYHRPLDFGSVS